MRPQVVLSARGYVLFNDSVFDKHHRRCIALVRRQYSGNVHSAIASIGLVTCVYVNPETDRFWLIDCLPPFRPRRGRQDYARARDQDAGPARHCLPHRAHGQLVRHYGPVQVVAGGG